MKTTLTDLGRAGVAGQYGIKPTWFYDFPHSSVLWRAEESAASHCQFCSGCTVTAFHTVALDYWLLFIRRPQQFHVLATASDETSRVFKSHNDFLHFCCVGSMFLLQVLWLNSLFLCQSCQYNALNLTELTECCLVRWLTTESLFLEQRSI